jgi:YVTN family beta-propeller protein
MKTIGRLSRESYRPGASLVAALFLAAAPAAAQFGPFAYVGSSEDLGNGPFAASVVVLDTPTDAIVATIPLSSSPQFLAVSPAGDLVLGTATGVGASGRIEDIHVIDAATRALIATVATVRNPLGVAFAPDGAPAYVVSSDPNDPAVAIFDPSTATVSEEIPLPRVGRGVSAIAITPDGSTAYVTPFAPGGTDERFSVSVIDLQSNTVEATIPLPCPGGFCLVQDIAITPDGTRAYVPIFGGNGGAGAGGLEPDVCVGDCDGDGTVTLGDLVTAVGVGLGSFSPDRCSRLDGNRDGRATIDELLDAVHASIMGCSLPLPTGDFAAVIDTSSNRLFAVIDFGPIAAGTEAFGSGAGTTSTQGIDVEITPDGQLAYVTGCGDDICVIDVSTNTVTETFSIGGLVYRLAITPDGSRAFVTRLGDLPVVTIDLPANTIGDPIDVGFPSGIAMGPATIAPAVIDVGRAVGDAGTQVVVSVSLQNGDFEVTTTSNDVIYLPDFVRLDAPVDCEINPEISADGPDCPLDGPCKILEVLPFNCPSEHCAPTGQRRQGFTALIFNDGGPAEFSPIPDGPLYSCRFTIQPLVPAGTTVALLNAGAEAGDRTHAPVPTRGENGEILVRGPVRLDVGSTTARPGERVPVPVTLQSGLFDVANATIAVAFDPKLLSLEPESDCALNPLIADTASSCPFRGACKTLTVETAVCGSTIPCPAGLEGNVVVLANVGGNPRPTPSGPLFDCRFSVAARVPVGTIATLRNLATEAADTRGMSLPSIGQDGFVRVLLR